MPKKYWQKHHLADLAADPQFRAVVHKLRAVLRASPEKRRHWEKMLTGTEEEWRLAGAGLYTLASFGEPPADADEQALRASAIHEGVKSLGYKREEFGSVLNAACWTDFDGIEFDRFCELTTPVEVIFWDPETGRQLDWSYSAWLRSKFRQERIYLDVTFASPEDVRRIMPTVNHVRQYLGLPRPKPGLPPDSKRRHRVLGDFTWDQIRSKVRRAPETVDAWENKYVASYVEEHGNTPEMRRRAMTNYRKRVRTPLNLRAGRGRRSAK